MDLTRVLLADDHEIVRAALHELIKKKPNFKIVGEAKSGREVLHLAKKLTPEVVLVEVLVEQPSGLKVLRKLQTIEAPVRGLVLSRCQKPWMAREALKNGAYGYLLKKDPPALLFGALQDVAHGRRGWLSPEIAAKLSGGSTSDVHRARRMLTAREWQVMLVVADGLHNSEIAKQLTISVGTTKCHVHNILGKLDMASRTELTAWVHRNDLLSAPPPLERITGWLERSCGFHSVAAHIKG